MYVCMYIYVLVYADLPLCITFCNKRTTFPTCFLEFLMPDCCMELLLFPVLPSMRP